jgi:anti-sigma factor RsiW
MMDDPTHDKVWGLIPWFVNGRLSNADALSVESHLVDCAKCREECAIQARIHEAIRDEESIAFASEASYRKLADRIEVSRERRPFGEQRLMRWLVAAVVIESLGLVGWGAWSWQAAHRQSLEARYVTLSSPAETSAPSGAAMRVVFNGDSTLADIQSLLRSVDARMIDGPTEGGVYTLAFSGARASEEDRVKTLRASQVVRFAEPVFAGTGVSP